MNFLILGIFLIVIGLPFMIISIRGERRLQEYEFNNRTDGGVVQFQNFKDSERHDQKRAWFDLLGKIGIWPFVLGAITTIISIISIVVDHYS